MSVCGKLMETGCRERVNRTSSLCESVIIYRSRETANWNGVNKRHLRDAFIN